MQTRHINFNGSEIFYKITGNGNQVVVLIHGFGEHSNIWDGLIATLESEYKLIVPDLPGSGRSGFVQGADIDTYALIVQQIMDKENADVVTMIGHSMGGYSTLAFAEKNQHRLNGIGLFHSSAFADDADKKEARKKGIASVKEDGVQPFMAKNIKGLFTESFAAAHQPLIDKLIDQVKGITAETVIQYYEAMMNRPDRIKVLENLPKPVLFIIGEHDKAIPLAVSLKQCYLPKIADVNILKASAHMGMLEEPDNAFKAVRRFLEDTLKVTSDVN